MPYQDQLYVGYTPLDYNDLRQLVGKFGRTIPAKLPSPRERNKIIDKIVDVLDESNALGTITVEGIGTIPVALYLPSWDADDDEWESLTVNPETGKLWAVIGVQLTSRYFPRILDKGFQHGRPDFFEIDISVVSKIVRELDEFLNLPTKLTLMVQFY
jgi:hypothetical protein